MMGILRDTEDGVARKEVTGRPEGRFMDVVREDMAEVEVTEEDAEDRTKWRWKIRCGEKPKEEEDCQKL